MVRGSTISIFRGPGTTNIDFFGSVDQKYRFFVVRGPKILIFCGPGIKKSIFRGLRGFATSRRAKSLKKQWKIMVLGGPYESPGGRRHRPTRQHPNDPRGLGGRVGEGGTTTLVLCS